MGFFDKIKQGLTKTKTKMDAQLTGIFAAYEPGDEEFFEDLEETLILADTGVETTTKAIAQLRKAIELKKLRTGAEVKKEFVQILARILRNFTVVVVTRTEMRQTVEDMKMRFAATLDEALDFARSLGKSSLTVIPNGISVIVTPACRQGTLPRAD